MPRSDGKRRSNSGRLIKVLFTIGLGLILMTACGKKGPPVPPEIVPPPPVSDLKAKIDGNNLMLTWTGVHKAKNKTTIKGYLVYRSKQATKSEFCEKCPILFEKEATVPVLNRAKKDKAAVDLKYHETLDKGFRYIYKVVALTRTGELGADSNIVRFTYEPEAQGQAQKEK
jgi:hypothetical protein